MHYLLFYVAGDDYVEKRARFRGQHLAVGDSAEKPFRPEKAAS